jgi:hypothetical protein
MSRRERRFEAETDGDAISEVSKLEKRLKYGVTAARVASYLILFLLEIRGEEPARVVWKNPVLESS